jgi:hypothetical protein
VAESRVLQSPEVEPSGPSAARLLKSSVELVRAEVALGLERGKVFSVRALMAVVAALLAAAWLQVALLLGVLYLLLEPRVLGASFVVAIAIPAGLGLLSSMVAIVCWALLARPKTPGRGPHRVPAGVRDAAE